MIYRARTSAPADPTHLSYAHAFKAAPAIEQLTHLHGRDPHYPCPTSCPCRHDAKQCHCPLLIPQDASVARTPLHHGAGSHRRRCSRCHTTAPLDDSSKDLLQNDALVRDNDTNIKAIVDLGDSDQGFSIKTARARR